MHSVKLFLFLFMILSLCGVSALADNHGIYDFGLMGVTETGLVKNVVQLTTNTLNDEAQCWGAYPWRHDGRMIVYQAEIGSSGGAGKEICIMDYNGSSGTWQRLTNNGTCDSHPSFTPDGNKIVFQRQLDNGRAEIWIMDADGDNPVNLTQAHSGMVCKDCAENKPVVSPDGTKIAFYSSDEAVDDGKIWVMSIDGSDPVAVSESYATHHTWSPDSKWVLFSADQNNMSRIYKVRPNGSSLTPLTDAIADFCANWAFWSPDGEWIAYHTRSMAGQNDVHTLSIMRPDGSGKEVLVAEKTDGVEWDTVCGPKSWSPDSKWIGFKKQGFNSLNRSSIFVLNMASRSVYQLTQDFNDYRLWWSPNNTQILFRDRGDNRDSNQNGEDLLTLNLNGTYFPEYKPITPAIPTLSEWGIMLLSLLLPGSALYMMGRKQDV